MSAEMWRTERDTAHAMIVSLINSGWLVGVSVFGADDCCEHGSEDCPSDGFGLCDQMAFHRTNPAYGPGDNHRFVGSDCNRAEPFLMRVNDPLMTDEIKALLSDQPDARPSGCPSAPLPAPQTGVPHSDTPPTKENPQ